MFSKGINRLLLGLFIVLIGIALWLSQHITFRYDFESFFPHHDADLDYYNLHRGIFGADDNFLLVALENEGRPIYEKKFLEKLDQFTHACDSISHIRQVHSITNLKRPVFVAGKLISVPWVSLELFKNDQEVATYLAADPTITNKFISGDGKAAAVFLWLDSIPDMRIAKEVNAGVKELLSRFNFSEHHLAGRPYYQELFVNRSNQEFVTYTLLSSLLILVVLILIFRRFWGIIISLISVFSGLILFFGFLGARGKPLDPMATLFPVLMIIIGMSDIVHIMIQYVFEKQRASDSRIAVKETLKEVGLATLLTAITTSIGFASLIVSNIPPIRQFGITAAIGVMIAFIATVMVATTILHQFPASKLMGPPVIGLGWQRFLLGCYRFTKKRKKEILIGTGIMLVICIMGMTRIDPNVHARNIFPRTEKVRDDFIFFENSFGGVRPYEMGIHIYSGKKLTDPIILRKLEQLENYLEHSGSLTSINSPVTIYRILNQAWHNGDKSFYQLPENDSLIERFTRLLGIAPESLLGSVMDTDRTHGRLSARQNDIGSDNAGVKLKETRHWIDRQMDTSMIKIRPTGSYFLLDKSVEAIRYSLIYDLLLAIGLIGLVMTFLFRDWRMILISIIPNIIPLAVTGAIFGYLNIELDASTAIIFTIAFGIVVDDTIHFLSKYKLERNKKRSVALSIRNTYLEAGKAICLTSVILFAGFSILITSAYPPTFYMGCLMVVTLITALASDLLVTPVLIYYLMGERTGLRSKALQNPDGD